MTEIQSMQLSNGSPRNRPRTKTQTVPKIDYKGITLKQYFLLYDKSIDHSTIQQIKQEAVQSSTSSLAQTPTFGHNKRDINKNKLKTQANEEQMQNYTKNINISFDQQNKFLNKQKKNTSSIQKLNASLMRKISCMKKPEKKGQKVKTLGVQQTDRSTLNGFYKAGKNINSNNPIQKRNRMLKKIKADRQRSQQIKQQDIFYITKYANKFKIDTKNLLQ